MCKTLIDSLDDAESLIDWTDRGRWGGNPFEWAFRGQWKDEWCVAPSAWRPDARYLVNGKWQASPQTSGEQCQAEYEMVRRFFRLGDVQGLPLPGDSAKLRARLEHSELEKFDKKGAWPPPKMHWLIAIAQHYGIPTRFIDWTRKPLIASWFAAEQAAKKCGESEDEGTARPEGRFVVWAIHRRSDVLRDLGWEFTSAPRSAVPNLHLQSGIFTFRPVQRKKFASPKDVTALCSEVITKVGSEEARATIRAASVPWSQAGRLLTLLRDRFVQPTTVYAGYDGVARSVKEHRWRRPLQD